LRIDIRPRHIHRTRDGLARQRVVSTSLSAAAYGDHRRSPSLGLTASTANPLSLRHSAIAPCLRSRKQIDDRRSDKAPPAAPATRSP
jgi:hypothetical protein